MITAIAALFLYIFDPRLALIVAVVGPSVESTDTSGTHANMLVLLLTCAGVGFVRKVSFDKEEA